MFVIFAIAVAVKCVTPKDTCKIIYNFKDIFFEDPNLGVFNTDRPQRKYNSNSAKNVFTGTTRLGAFSTALYDPISGAIFLLSPYTQNAKVSYFFTADYPALTQPRLRPYPDLEMNQMSVSGNLLGNKSLLSI